MQCAASGLYIHSAFIQYKAKPTVTECKFKLVECIFIHCIDNTLDVIDRKVLSAAVKMHYTIL